MVRSRLKFFLLTLVFVFNVSILPVQCLATGTNSSSSITTADGYKFNMDTGTITAYSGNGGDIVIPSEINGVKVGCIGWQAFSNCSSLKSVIIPNSVTKIAIGSFSECKNLISVTLPDSVTSIGSGAFRGCTSLDGITIPNGVTSLDSGVFSCCSSLTEIYIPKNISSIDVSDFGGNAFGGCKNLSAINVNPENAYFCSLNGILFNKSKTTILKYPAKNTAASYTIPNTVTRIENNAFEYCLNLKEIIIQDSVTSIGTEAFMGCTGLKDITLPGSITQVGESIFRDCNLDSMTISKGLKGLWGIDDEGSLAFCDINTIILEEGATAIQDGEFTCCNFENLTIPNSVTSIGMYAFFGSNCKGITIPDSVTSIGEGAFGACGLTEINIPGSVTSIGRFVFTSNNELTAINVDAENKNYSSINGVLLDKNQTTLLACPEGITSISYSIPDGVTGIGDYAFFACRTLTDINLPNGITRIGDGAFARCSRLNSINIPDGITNISKDVFIDCDNLNSITIPASVMDIDEHAFSSCRNLNIKTYSGTFADAYAQANKIPVEYIAEPTDQYIITADGYRFNKDTGIITAYSGNGGDIVIPSEISGVKVIGIGDETFKNRADLTGITIPNTVNSIGSGAFYKCINLKSITIPDSVTSLGYGIFAGCEFASLIIPNTIKSFFALDDGGPFCDCKVKNIIVEDGTTAIADFEFALCSFENISIPNSVKTIGTSSFLNCDFMDITIPDSVTIIGDYAFLACDFSKITIPNGVTSIGEGAFCNCQKLTDIIIPDSVTSIGNYVFKDCPLNFAIITYPGSYADKYAQANNIAVKYISNPVPEDVNMDRAVNLKDVVLVASHFNTISTDSNYAINCDLNKDRAINMKDIIMIAEKFNYTY